MSFYSQTSHDNSFATSISKFCISRMLVAALFACLIVPALPANGQLNIGPRDGGQDNTDADGSGSSTRNDQPDAIDVDSMPPGKLFQTMVTRIKQNEVAVNHLYSTMPLGFPALQREHMSKIDMLEAQTEQLKAGLDQAALNAFKAAPGQDPVATQRVFRMLSEMIDPTFPESVFDPATALQIVDTLMDAGADGDPVILSKGFRASFALDDYDRAGMMLDRIEEVNPEADLAQIRSVVEEMNEKWQRELSIRRLEKNNDNLPKVKFETTAGDFVVALYEDYAPNTVANFISLVKKKFYNDLTFHYVKPGKYVHGGCPNGDSTGGPGYSIASEFSREQIRHFFSGTLGMANTGPDTEGSQFVITHQAMPELNGNFTAFGRVIEGFDIIRSARRVDPADPLPVGNEKVNQPIKFIKAEVIWKRDHEYEPVRVTKSADSGFLKGTESASTSDDGFSPRSATEDVPAVDGGGLFTPGQP